MCIYDFLIQGFNHQRCKCYFFLEILIAFPYSVSIEAFAVCENYAPPEGFNPRDLHRLLEKVGSPSGGSDLGKKSHTFTFKNLKLLQVRHN